MLESQHTVKVTVTSKVIPRMDNKRNVKNETKQKTENKLTGKGYESFVCVYAEKG